MKEPVLVNLQVSNKFRLGSEYILQELCSNRDCYIISCLTVILSFTHANLIHICHLCTSHILHTSGSFRAFFALFIVYDSSLYCLLKSEVCRVIDMCLREGGGSTKHNWWHHNGNIPTTLLPAEHHWTMYPTAFKTREIYHHPPNPLLPPPPSSSW